MSICPLFKEECIEGGCAWWYEGDSAFEYGGSVVILPTKAQEIQNFVHDRLDEE
jgi:hypothetical protein